ncbi:MAG TPA: carboxypeptidase regulatory-like domain-containing protein [Candidatus Angelobacter sp.]|nr:carboxypeptidase regulatory-like domain-containing protein [Candidatus Angelobacter sp.]
MRMHHLHKRGTSKYVLTGFGLLLLMISTAVAQTSRGTVTGTVRDSSNAVIHNAIVTITQADTNVSRKTTTNDAGIYRFDAVDLGTYNVAVQSPGFSSETKTGVIVQAAHTTDLDFALRVGTAQQIVTVEASAAEVGLQTSDQVRGETLSSMAIQNLPLIGGDSLTLVQLAPGVALASSNSINQNGNLNFVANGQRPRGNNFMIDGVENNDISVTGPAFTISIPDAVTEVNIQTADFSSEFGRSGGAVINQVTNSGTNKFHGSGAYVYTGSAFQALNHSNVLAHQTAPPRAVENIPDFTIGGPVVIPGLYNGRGKTFFFGAAQWDRLFGSTTANVQAPDNAGVALLQSLAASCPNAALYLQALGTVRGNPAASPTSINLAVPSAAGTCNGTTRAGMTLTTGLFGRSAAQSALDNNHLVRVDHTISDKQTLSGRWLYDSNVSGPFLNNLPGFDRNFTGTTMNGLFTDTYLINSRWTNEFRFDFGSIGFNFPLAATDPFHATLANYAIAGVTGFGGATNIPQFRYADNFQYQDTMSLVRGKHTFRFGVDFLQQVARQHPPFNERGSFAYAASTIGGPVTAFANFLDDFGGKSGSLNRQFGTSIYHPNLFRQAYFFQDSWKTTSNLTLNLGLRYEYYGSPENTFAVAAFTNYDPINFAAPNSVAGAKNNWGPSVGFAWNPRGEDWLHRMAGGEKMVWRGGFQISYDSAFNNLLSNIAGSSPNTLGGIITSVSSAGTPRGAGNFSSLFAGIAPTPPTAQSPQQNLFLTPFDNPQTDRWSLGFEREMPYGLIWDTSYVGSVSHHLYRSIDMNPIVNPVTGARFQPQVGIRTVRSSSANSNYEALQFELKRNFKSTPIGSMLFLGNYTYSHSLDDVSDVFGFDSTPSSFQSVSQVLGASPHIDYGNSDFDRRHVGVISLVWDVRGPKNGFMGQVFGGWQASGIAHWQTGFPFTMINGSDRNGDGQTAADRPDISNPAAPLNTRAVLNSACATGYANPDLNGACVNPNTVHWIEGIGAPNANTVGRNTMLAPGLNNLNLAIAKKFKITEGTNLEYRVEMFNALNTTNFGNFVAPRTINSGTITPVGQPTTFLDVTQTESFGRSMRMRLKFSF